MTSSSSALRAIPSPPALATLPPLTCPKDQSALLVDGEGWRCPRCGPLLRHLPRRNDFVEGIQTAKSQAAEQIRFAYRLYSIAYPVLAVFALWLVWGGSVRAQIRWFAAALRRALDAGGRVLDVATGDGSLTHLALKKNPGHLPLAMVDLSGDMLRKAYGKVRRHQPKLLYIEDIAQVCFPPKSFGHATCYGGINSFSEPQACLARIRELLTDDGLFSGSYLLRPLTRRRSAFVDFCLRHGLQCTSLDEPALLQLFAASGFTVLGTERHGQMLLFSLRKA